MTDLASKHKMTKLIISTTFIRTVERFPSDFFFLFCLLVAGSILMKKSVYTCFLLCYITHENERPCYCSLVSTLCCVGVVLPKEVLSPIPFFHRGYYQSLINSYLSSSPSVRLLSKHSHTNTMLSKFFWCQLLLRVLKKLLGHSDSHYCPQTPSPPLPVSQTL